MARYKHQGTFQDRLGRIVSDDHNGVATYYKAGTSDLATVYAASSGGSAISGSAVSVDSNGYFEAWVDDTDYFRGQKFKVVLSGTNFTSATYDDLDVFNTLEYRYYVDFNEADQGVAGGGNSIKDLVDSIGSAEETLVFTPGTYTITTAETIPANIAVVFQKGAVLSGAGALTMTGKAVKAEWWGVSTGAAATVNDAAMEAALASSDVVSLTTPGTYNFDNITFPASSGKRLEIGRGVIVNKSASSAGNSLIAVDGVLGSTTTTLTANTKIGDNSITVTSNASFSVDDYLFLEDGEWDTASLIPFKSQYTQISEFASTVTLSGTTSGSVDGILASGVEIMSGAVAYDTDFTTTAANVVTNINANTSVPNYTATSSGAVITIVAVAQAPFTVTSSSTTLTSTDANHILHLSYPTTNAYLTASTATITKVDTMLTDICICGEGRLTNTVAVGTASSGITANYTDRLIIRGLDIVGFRDDFISVKHSVSPKITDCFVRDGISFGSGEAYGINFDRATSYGEISKNHCRFLRHGIVMTQGASFNKIFDNIIEGGSPASGSTNGIDTHGAKCHNNTITDNTVTGASQDGITIFDNECDVIGNTVVGSGRYGISVRKKITDSVVTIPSNTRVVGNYVQQAGTGAGIYVHTLDSTTPTNTTIANDVVVQKNEIYMENAIGDSTVPGIYGAGISCNVLDNTVTYKNPLNTNSDTRAIYIEEWISGANVGLLGAVRISNNRVNGGFTGISIKGRGDTGFVIENNKVIGVENDAISVSAPSGQTITNAQITSNTYYAVNTGTIFIGTTRAVSTHIINNVANGSATISDFIREGTGTLTSTIRGNACYATVTTPFTFTDKTGACVELVAARAGDLAVNTSEEIPVFIAPGPTGCLVTDVQLVSRADITQNDTDYLQIDIVNRLTGAGTGVVVPQVTTETTGTGGLDFDAYTPLSLGTTTDNANGTQARMVAGSLVTIKLTDVNNGQAVSDLVVIIKYVTY